MSELAQQYPRVLVVAAQPINHEPHGLMMANLFQDWPLDRLAQVHAGLEGPLPELCRRHWRVTLADVPVDRLVRRAIGGRRDQLLGRPSAGSPPALGKAVSGERSRVRTAVHGIASSWADCLRYRLPGEFWDWVADFQPDVTYSLLGTIRIMTLAIEIADRVGRPLVPHFMDDWPSTHYRSSVLSRIPRRVMLSRIRAVVRRAPFGLTICKAMGEEYQRRYGLRFAEFMNCVEVPPECPSLPARGADHPVRFLYVGGLHLGRWRSLTQVGAALDRLAQQGYPTELLIYARPAELQEFGPALTACRVVRLGGTLAPDEVLPTLREADVLLHVEAFDDTIRAYTRLSLSTKIPQCMSSGRPILAYGPAELASVRYVEECGCGRVVGSDDSSALAAAVKELALDAGLRQRLGRRGWEIAHQRHNAQKERERFRRVLALAANGNTLP
jgi:glycosyltransferase involved in cell wall biosynthesis